MRKLLGIGDGFPLTIVTLLVCLPVAFGLAAILFEPFRDPVWIMDLVRNPAKSPTTLLFTLLLFRSLARPSKSADSIEEGNVVSTELTRTADMLWAMAIGIVACVVIVVDDPAKDLARPNIAAFVAVGLTAGSVVLEWLDRARERRPQGYR